METATRRGTRYVSLVRDHVAWMQGSVHGDLPHGGREGHPNGLEDLAGGAARFGAQDEIDMVFPVAEPMGKSVLD